MQTSEKINELLLRKFRSNIVTLNNEKSKTILILDSDSGALFTIANNFLFTFKDAHDTIWSTIPKNPHINNQQYYPKIGDKITQNDGIQCFFTTKEQIVEMAFDYFSDFIDPFFGLDVIWSGAFYHEIINQNERFSYELIEIKFKSAFHKEIEYYISSN